MIRLEGAILVGGRSRRMGRDKALLPVAGRPMIERIAERMRPLVERVRAVGGATDLSLPPELARVPDRRPGLGPLSGIHAALASAELEAVLVVACDLPLVTTGLLREIAAGLEEDVDASVPRGPEGAVPVCAAYRADSLPQLESYLSSGARSAKGFVESLRVRWLDETALRRIDPSGRALLNVNTPEDYREAVSRAEAEE